MTKILKSQFVASTLDTILVKLPKLIFKTIVTALVFLREAILVMGGKKIDSALARLAKWYIAHTSDLDKSLVLFISAQNDFSCNPKYIALELLRRNSDVKITWAISNQTRGPFPNEIEFVEFDSPDFYQKLAEARIVIVNNHALQLHRAIKKKANQFWIQTWHGSLGFKKLEGAGGMHRLYNKIRALDIRQTDFLVSNSQFEDDVYSSTYWPGVPSKRLGHARNDILFDRSSETYNHLRKKVLTRLGVPDTGQKFVLFAPTHDDSSKTQSFGHLDFSHLTGKLAEKFGGTWEVLIRVHGRNRARSRSWFSTMPSYVHNASSFPDMQELLIVSDAGVTDYSSWILDYLITRKPGFLFGSNIGEYEISRGFYHDFADTPFELATTNDELLANIASFDQLSYETRIEKFFDACQLMDDGLASSRIADFVLELAATPISRT